MMFLALIFACVDDAEPTWHSDIQPLMAENCLGCHAEGGLGAFPLETFDQVYAVRDAVHESVAEGRMPPWLADSTCNDYDGDITMSDADMALLTSWIDGGALEGDGDGVEPASAPAAVDLDRVDLTLEMPVSYTPQTEDDDYRCFLLDWPLDETVHVTGYDVNPGADAVVHHVIAYIIDPDQVAEYQSIDDADDGAGWSCFGSAGGSEDPRWLGGWAPGGPPATFAPGTGIPVYEGSKIVMQVHYNVESNGVEADHSTIDVRYETEVDKPAIIQPWADPGWIDTEAMHIPAGSTGTTHQFSYALPVDVLVYSASLHMHTLGTRGRIQIDRADGTETCLLDVPRWDFNWQRPYRFTEPVLMEAGDSLTIECEWDNPGDADVYWGDGTGDEMCLGTMFMTYP